MTIAKNKLRKLSKKGIKRIIRKIKNQVWMINNPVEVTQMTQMMKST